MSRSPTAGPSALRHPRELAHAAHAARGGCPIPWDTEPHRLRCSVCALDLDQLEGLEAQFLAWVPTKQLAGEYGVTTQAIDRHAAVYLLDLRRVAELAPVYSRLIAAGVQAAEAGQATPEHALRALDQLVRHGKRAELREHDPERGTAELLDRGASGAVLMSYEEKVRTVRARLAAGDQAEQIRRSFSTTQAAGDDPEELAGPVLPADELAQHAHQADVAPPALVGTSDAPTIRAARGPRALREAAAAASAIAGDAMERSTIASPAEGAPLTPRRSPVPSSGGCSS